MSTFNILATNYNARKAEDMIKDVRLIRVTFPFIFKN